MDAEGQLEGFIAKFAPEVAADARRALAALTARLPTAARLVYDNYNALAIAFAPGERASQAILSIAIYPRYVSLFLVGGPSLPDPTGLLEGGGSTMSHVKLRPVTLVESEPVSALIDAAIAAAPVPLPTTGTGRLIVKSVSAKQRPRRSE